MPIGNPVTLTSNVASKTISATATASQTLFNVTGGYRINSLGVFKNGSRLQDGVDYTARDGLTVTLLSAASGGDKLQFVVFDTFRVAEAIKPAVDEQTIRGNLNVVGILSCTDLEGPVSLNITSGIQTFHDVRVGGALTVAGTITYEDVGNTNTTGIATFSGGMLITGVGATVTTLNVTGVSTFAGAINGNLTGNVTGNTSGTAGGLSGTPNIDCGTGSFTGDVDIADKIIHTGDTDTAIRFPATDTITAETGGSERVRIDSSGRLLVATTSASGTHKLQVNGSAQIRVGESLILQNAAGSAEGSIECAGAGSNTDIRIRTNSTERLRVNHAGNVGINTASPDRQLHVFSTNGTVAHFESGNANEISQIVFEGLGASAPPNLGATGNDLHFTTNNTERLRITSAGITTVVSGSFAIPSVPEANTDNAELPVLFQTQAGTVDGGSGLTYNPAGDQFSVNGLVMTSQVLRTSGSNTLRLTTANGNGQSDVRVTTSSVQLLGGSSTRLNVSAYGVEFGPGILQEAAETRADDISSGANFDVLSGNILYYEGSANGGAAQTINIRGNGSTTFNTVSGTDKVTSLTVIHQPNSSEYVNAITIDGSSQTVEWSGGSPPSSASSSAFEVIALTIIKTASATYKVLAAVSEFD